MSSQVQVMCTYVVCFFHVICIMVHTTYMSRTCTPPPCDVIHIYVTYIIRMCVRTCLAHVCLCDTCTTCRWLTVTFFATMRYCAMLLSITSRKNHKCWGKTTYAHQISSTKGLPRVALAVDTVGHFSEQTLIQCSLLSVAYVCMHVWIYVRTYVE